MGYYTLAGEYPHNAEISAYMPENADSKETLIRYLERAFEEYKGVCAKYNEDFSRSFDWLRYFTGWSENCGELYVLNRRYADEIGYSGPTTYKGEDFIVISGRSAYNYNIGKSRTFNDMVKQRRYR